MLRITPIYGSSLSSPNPKNTIDGAGAGDDDNPPEWLSSPAPSSTLVEYAGMKLLLNVGWDESLPSAPPGGAGAEGPSAPAGAIEPIPDELPDVDAVLVTDSTLASLGGLPVYFGASAGRRRGRAPRSRTDDPRGGGGGGSDPPFLATHPTVKMGQMALYDHHASLSLDGTDPGYSLEDVDAVFSGDSFLTLKYSQTVYLPLDDGDDGGGGGGSKTNKKKLLSVTPHLSGRVVGGCYYVLRRLADDTQVILAPTYHHAKEKHLAGCTLHKFGASADALLVAPGGPRGLLGRLYEPPPKAGSAVRRGGKPALPPPAGSRSEAELVELVMAALRRDGNALLPVDASGRVLELLLVLDRHWERQRLGGAYNLCWVGPVARVAAEFARSQLEWMAEPLGAQFDSQRGHPYALKSVRICSSVSELEGVIEGSGGNPTVALASGPSLDHGPARDLLLKWGDNPDNLVLITDSTRCVPRGDVWFAKRGEKSDNIIKEERRVLPEEKEADEDGKLVGTAMAPADASSYTAASQLLYHWCLAKARGEEMADVVAIDVHVPHRAALAGAELKAFLADEEAERIRIQAEEEKKAMMQEIEQAKGRLRLGEDDAGGGTGGKSSGSGTAVSKGTGSTGVGRPKKKSRFDQNLFIKFSKPVHMTFDVREEAVGIGQPDSVAKYGIGESVGRSGEVFEDDYGISVKAESFVDIVTGVDPSKFSGGTGRIGEEVMRRGLGFGADGRPVLASSGGRAGETNEPANIDGIEDESGINEKMLEVADLSNGKGIVKGRNGRPPIKVSTLLRKLEVLAEVSYIPLEGRVDARAARQSVRALQPRHLVVIGGPKDNAKLLTEALKTAGPSNAKPSEEARTFAPADGETVQLAVGHAAYSVRLVDTPYISQSEKEAMDLAGKEMEPVESHEAKIGECSVSLVDFVATGKKWAVDGSVVLAPRLQNTSSLSQSSLMLSTREVLLTDLRAEVTALGMKAEYGALSGYSQLIVNGKIYVRKDNITGKLNIEGPLCEDFFNVRSVVCGQYVTLTS